VIDDAAKAQQVTHLAHNCRDFGIQLFDLLDKRKVEFVLVGGIAMLAYVDGRNTQVLDLIVAANAIDDLPELTVEDRNPNFARTRFGELQIDLPDTTVTLGPGQMFIVPKGVQHRPRAVGEVHLLLIEPTGTPNSGDVQTAVPRRVI